MTVLDHVSFKILLKAHNGDFQRAKQAWDSILSLGGFGGVPLTYEGGLDIRGLRVAADEQSQGGNEEFMTFNADGEPLPPTGINPDNIKRIEDLAVGDI